MLRDKIHTHLSYIWSSVLTVVDSLNLIITTEELQHMWQQITALCTSQSLWTFAPSNTFLLDCFCCCCRYLDWSLMLSCINRAIVRGNGLVSFLCILVPSWRWILFQLQFCFQLFRNRREWERTLTAGRPVTTHSLFSGREGGASSVSVSKSSFPCPGPLRCVAGSLLLFGPMSFVPQVDRLAPRSAEPTTFGTVPAPALKATVESGAAAHGRSGSGKAVAEPRSDFSPSPAIFCAHLSFRDIFKTWQCLCIALKSPECPFYRVPETKPFLIVSSDVLVIYEPGSLIPWGVALGSSGRMAVLLAQPNYTD